MLIFKSLVNQTVLKCWMKVNLFSKIRKINTRMETHRELEVRFRNLIDENGVMVFSKTTCPFCFKVKKIFEDLKVEITTLELNEFPEEKCAEMQDVLLQMSGQRTVPNVYINKIHVGGCTDTQKALADGTIYDMIEGTYQKYNFDLVVIGGGSGGLASAKEAASYQRRVALCDLVLPSPQGTSWGLGGTCVNVGCIPKKLMHKAALLGEDIKDAPHFGWTTETREHSWTDMVESIGNYIRSLNWKYRKSLKDNNVTYYNKYARFIDSHTLALYNKDGEVEQKITSQNFLLAMGCRPVYPEFPGAKEFCISSDDIFSMSEKPGKTLIIGASYIALETAGFLISLGCHVTVMVRSVLLRGFDKEIASMIGSHMETLGVTFMYNYEPVSVSRREDGQLSVVSWKKSVEETIQTDNYQTVFLAVGRQPCTKDLNLKEINVKLDEKGMVLVNEANQTSLRNIFAVGDIIEDKLQLTPVAIQQGKLLAQRLFGLKTTLFDYESVPTTVFTPLEYGCVGLSEEAAIEKYTQKDIEVYHIHFQPLEWELSSRSKGRSFAKVVCRKSEKERIVGFHYLGPNAGEVTQGFALGIKLKATKEDLDNLIGIHPTCAEVFTTMTVTKASGKPAEASGC